MSGQELAEHVIGTTMTLNQIVRSTGIGVLSITSALDDAGIGQCRHCNKWCYLGELDDNDGLACEDCR